MVCTSEAPMLQAKLPGLIRLPIDGGGIAARAGQADRREEGGAGRIHIGMGGIECGFGFRHVGTAQQHFGGKAGLHHGRDDAVQILRLDVETFRRAAEKDGQRIARFAFLLDQGRAGAPPGSATRPVALARSRLEDTPLVTLASDHGQDALGGVDILAGDGDALARGQHGEIFAAPRWLRW